MTDYTRQLRCAMRASDIAPTIAAAWALAHESQAPVAWTSLPPHLKALLLEVGSRILLALGPQQGPASLAVLAERTAAINTALARYLAPQPPARTRTKRSQAEAS